MKTEAQKSTQLEPKDKLVKEPWNKGKLMGQKPPLKLNEVWEIRIRVLLGKRLRELTLFNLAIDNKPRGYDLVKLKVRDVAHGDNISKRAMIMQQKTHQPVQFELTEQTRNAVSEWIRKAKLKNEDFLFPSWIIPYLQLKRFLIDVCRLFAINSGRKVDVCRSYGLCLQAARYS